MNGWELLALCILSPKYMPIERILYRLKNGIPLIAKHRGKEGWLTAEIADEIRTYSKTYSKTECAKAYGLTWWSVHRICQKRTHNKKEGVKH